MTEKSISVSINQVFLAHSDTIHLSIVFGCFHAIMADLCSYNRWYGPQNPKYLAFAGIQTNLTLGHRVLVPNLGYILGSFKKIQMHVS